MINVLGIICRENQSHILCSVTFPDNSAVYEVMWESRVEPDRPRMSIQYSARALHAV